MRWPIGKAFTLLADPPSNECARLIKPSTSSLALLARLYELLPFAVGGIHHVLWSAVYHCCSAALESNSRRRSGVNSCLQQESQESIASIQGPKISCWMESLITLEGHHYVPINICERGHTRVDGPCSSGIASSMNIPPSGSPVLPLPFLADTEGNHGLLLLTPSVRRGSDLFSGKQHLLLLFHLFTLLGMAVYPAFFGFVLSRAT